MQIEQRIEQRTRIREFIEDTPRGDAEVLHFLPRLTARLVA
jgi:hypothetical protein